MLLPDKVHVSLNMEPGRPWLTKALDLPDNRWWGQDMAHTPLLQEVLKVIQANMPRSQKFMLPHAGSSQGPVAPARS